MKTSAKFKYIKIFFCLTYAVIGFSAFSQDSLFVKYKSDPLSCKIIEIGLNEILYKNSSDTIDKSILQISKERVWKIKLENGTYIRMQDFIDTIPRDSKFQNRLFVKIDPIIAIRRVVSFGIEYEINTSNSLEFGAAYIGLGSYHRSGFLIFDKVNGGFVRAGWKHKFPLKKDRLGLHQNFWGIDLLYLNHVNTASSLKEYYIADREWVDFRFTGAGLFLNLGKQWHLNEYWSLDVFGGMGMGYKTRETLHGAQITNIDYFMFMEDSGSFGFLTTSMYLAKIAPVFQAGFKLGFKINTLKSSK